MNKSGKEHEDQRRLYLAFLGIALTILLVSASLALEEVGKFVYFGFIGFLFIFLVFFYMNQLWLAKTIFPLVAFMMITWFIYGAGIHDEAWDMADNKLSNVHYLLVPYGLPAGENDIK